MQERSDFCKKLCSVPFSSAKFVLMMPDRCADQYLYDKTNNLIAYADMDAYVVAPAEWELAFLSKQFSDRKALRKGYEQYQPMPDFDVQSDYFTFLMNLNAPWDKEETVAFLAGKQPQSKPKTRPPCSGENGSSLIPKVSK